MVAGLVACLIGAMWYEDRGAIWKPTGVDDLQEEVLRRVPAVDGKVELAGVVSTALGYGLIGVVPGIGQSNMYARQGIAPVIYGDTHYVLAWALIIVPQTFKKEEIGPGGE